MWDTELWCLSTDPVLMASEVTDRLTYGEHPMDVITGRMHELRKHPSMAVLDKLLQGASDTFSASVIRDVAVELKLKSTHMQLVRDVVAVLADIQPRWQGKVSDSTTPVAPEDRMKEVMAALRERAHNVVVEKSARAASAGSGSGEAVGTSAPLTVSRQREWNNVISGSMSRPFSAIVAAVELYRDVMEDNHIKVISLIMRGADKMGPCHPCQDFMMQSVSAAVPGVHACFALWSPLRRKMPTYYSVRTGMPDGGMAPSRAC